MKGVLSPTLKPLPAPLSAGREPTQPATGGQLQSRTADQERRGQEAFLYLRPFFPLLRFPARTTLAVSPLVLPLSVMLGFCMVLSEDLIDLHGSLSLSV